MKKQNEGKTGKSKEKDRFSVIVLDLRRKTGLIGFSILMCAAVVGFVQTRRAAYEWNDMTQVIARKAESGSEEAIEKRKTEYGCVFAFEDEEFEKGVSYRTSSSTESNRSALNGKPMDSDGSKYTFTAKKSVSSAKKKASTAKKKTTTAKKKTTTTTQKKTTTTQKKTTTETAAGKIHSVRITVTPVNIRSGAGKSYSVVERTKKGKVYPLLSTKKDAKQIEWCQVEIKSGKTGWIMKSYCQMTEDTESAKEQTVSTSKTISAAKTTVTTAKKTTAAQKTTTTTKKTSAAKKTTATTKKTTAAKKTTATTKKTTAAKKTTATTKKTTTAYDENLIKKIQPKDREAKYFIVVYKGSQSVVVYGKDKKGDYTKAKKIFTCSTGKKSSYTRTGTYKIRAKYRWRYLVGGVYGQYSSSISKNYLFHSVPYEKKDASTLKNKEYEKLGTPASKGCVRMCVRDCKWIYDKCAVGTFVRIVDDCGPEGPGVPPRKKADRFSGWDPSDKWADDNPYFA